MTGGGAVCCCGDQTGRIAGRAVEVVGDAAQMTGGAIFSCRQVPGNSIICRRVMTPRLRPFLVRSGLGLDHTTGCPGVTGQAIGIAITDGRRVFTPNRWPLAGIITVAGVAVHRNG